MIYAATVAGNVGICLLRLFMGKWGVGMSGLDMFLAGGVVLLVVLIILRKKQKG